MLVRVQDLGEVGGHGVSILSDVGLRERQRERERDGFVPGAILVERV